MSDRSFEAIRNSLLGKVEEMRAIEQKTGCNGWVRFQGGPWFKVCSGTSETCWAKLTAEKYSGCDKKVLLAGQWPSDQEGKPC